jgi:hypothetical protein
MPATSGQWASAFSSPSVNGYGQGKLVGSLLASLLPHSFIYRPFWVRLVRTFGEGSPVVPLSG